MKEPHPMTARHVKAARALLGWSQARLAKEAGVAQSTVADFERGHRIPTFNTLLDIESTLIHQAIWFLYAHRGDLGDGAVLQ